MIIYDGILWTALFGYFDIELIYGKISSKPPCSWTETKGVLSTLYPKEGRIFYT